MNCKEIQELLLTDYVDGEAAHSQKELVEKHLGLCPACQNFSQEVRKSALEPFGSVVHPAPPEYLWHRIKDAIIAEEEDVSPKPAVFQNFLQYFSSHLKPALAFAVLVILLLTGGSAKIMVNQQKARAQAQMDYLVSLTDVSSGLPVMENRGFGTDMEEYFL